MFVAVDEAIADDVLGGCARPASSKRGSCSCRICRTFSWSAAR